MHPGACEILPGKQPHGLPLQVHFRKRPTEADVDLMQIARDLPGLTGPFVRLTAHNFTLTFLKAIRIITLSHKQGISLCIRSHTKLQGILASDWEHELA